MPCKERSTSESMISLMALTFAATSGHCTHMVSSYSMTLRRSYVSSWFLAILTSIWPKIRGKVSGLFSCHALMNLRHCMRSLATVGDLNSRSMKNPMTMWIFSSLSIGATLLVTLSIFFKMRMHVSLKVLSRSLRSNIFRSLGYIVL